MGVGVGIYGREGLLFNKGKGLYTLAYIRNRRLELVNNRGWDGYCKTQIKI